VTLEMEVPLLRTMEEANRALAEGALSEYCRRISSMSAYLALVRAI
jgi:hypothetical protein